MALTIPIPEEKTFYFKLQNDDTDSRGRLVRCRPEEGYDCYVSFRQATQGDNRVRAEITGKREWRLSDDGADVVEVNYENFPALVERDVFLTMTGTDIECPGVELAFEGSPRRCKSEQDFRKWWGALPMTWAIPIYDACLEVNPLWRTKR